MARATERSVVPCHGLPRRKLPARPTMAIRRRRIMYVQYVNPGMYPPLEHSSRILADAGWEVCFGK